MIISFKQFLLELDLTMRERPPKPDRKKKEDMARKEYDALQKKSKKRIVLTRGRSNTRQAQQARGAPLPTWPGADTPPAP